MGVESESLKTLLFLESNIKLVHLTRQ